MCCCSSYATTPSPHQCPAGTATDGVWDETLFIDVLGCHDEPKGDAYVGAVLPKAPRGRTDATCTITEAFDGDVYPNFAAYVAANPGTRYTHNFGPNNGNAAAHSFIISDFGPQRYLVYRINMRTAP
jgi:hypothetical protein